MKKMSATITKLCSVLLVLFMIISAAACGTQQNPQEPVSKETSAAVTDKPAESQTVSDKVLELDMWTFGDGWYGGNVKENIVQEAMAKKTGVKITKVVKSDKMDDMEKFNLMYAAGELPALFLVPNWAPKLLAKIDEADLAYRFTDDEIRQSCPELYQVVSPVVWDIWKRSDGKHVFIPNRVFHANAYIEQKYPEFTRTYANTVINECNVMVFRDDILKELCPSAKTEKELEDLAASKGTLTFEDYHVPELDSYTGFISYLQKAKEKYGDKGVIPLSSADINSFSRAFLGGTFYCQFEPQTMKPFSVAVEKKDQLNALVGDMNKLYQQGIIDRDFAILKTEQVDEKKNNGIYAVLPGGGIVAANIALQNAGKPYRYRHVPVSYSTGDLVTADGIAMLETGRAPLAWVLNKQKIKQEDAKKVLGYLDFCVTEEGMKLMSWGPEEAGLWQMADGKPQWKDPAFSDVVAGKAEKGKIKDYDYYGLFAAPNWGDRQPIFSYIFFHPKSIALPTVPVAGGNMDNLIGTALNAYNKGYWDNAYSGWNTTAKTNDQFWNNWGLMNDTLKKAVVAKNKGDYEKELNSFYDILKDKVKIDEYMQDQGQGYLKFAKVHKDQLRFHPSFNPDSLP